MVKRITFDNAIHIVLMLYVFFLPMALILLLIGDWQLLALNSAILLVCTVIEAALEGPMERRKQQR